VTGLVDTHCHLQAKAFEHDLADVVARARTAGVTDMVVCAGDASDWSRTRAVAREYGLGYMLGIHPLFVPKAKETDLQKLSTLAESSMADPHFIGIGEIGLEGLVMTIDERQEHFFREQLKIASRLDLPCSIHVRKSASRLLYHLKRVRVSGVIHAFNGSIQERDAFLALGLKLGFGGAVTYEGSRRIRRHLAEVPADAFVLESDSPDMPSSVRRAFGILRTEPADAAETAAVAALLREVPRDELVLQSTKTAQAVFNRLKLRQLR
jgi:TatD DNase family protein